MDINDMPVYMEYEAYAILNDGNNPTPQREVMDNILKGKTYIVTFKNTQHQITIGTNHHLVLKPYIPAKKP